MDYKTMLATQKFPIGARVRIADDLGPSMSHFPAGRGATVLWTYGYVHGGDNAKSYCLEVDGKGRHAWYREHQLTLEDPSVDYPPPVKKELTEQEWVDMFPAASDKHRQELREMYNTPFASDDDLLELLEEFSARSKE